MKKITIVTDAWKPQINGVVRSIEQTVEELRRMGIEVALITPQMFTSIPCPTYPEIRLALTVPGQIGQMLASEEPTYVHIATEGPLGLSARAWCLRMGKPFSTSYHTRFPEYVAARWPIPESLAYAYVRYFHNAGNLCMVATESLQRELSDKGFQNLARWSRGIDARLFHPMAKLDLPFGLPRPIFMTVGRVAVEKNLPAFLDLDLPGSKVIVGDGPAREELQARYPNAHFTGFQTGTELAETYAQADVFVFPSKTDTFGNTILEAMASGVPVAAYPVTGPGDILKGQQAAGALDEDLHAACRRALQCSPAAARELAESYSWRAATEQFWRNVLLANEQGTERLAA
ncbi:MAG TPA: glycosyltransferase family 1 protein [Ensifer sp.]|nr:glycosyltransferase family 1 protein [Ensifer sp.]